MAQTFHASLYVRVLGGLAGGSLSRVVCVEPAGDTSATALEECSVMALDHADARCHDLCQFEDRGPGGDRLAAGAGEIATFGVVEPARIATAFRNAIVIVDAGS